MGDPVDCQNFFGDPEGASGDCPLSPLDARHQAWILGDAARLLAQFSNSSICHELAESMEARIGEIYQTPDFFWDSRDGGMAGGDFHAPSTGRPEEIHLSTGIDSLNPDIGEAWFTEIARHEFAHAIGRGIGGEPDSVAQHVATASCGPDGDGGAPSGPQGPVHPTVTRYGFANPFSTGDGGWVN